MTETTFDDAPKASVDKVKNQAPTSRVKVITIVKTGDITYQCIKTPDRQSESWRIGPLQYNVTNGAGSFSGTDPAEPNYAPMEPVDLPECAWISRKNFHDFMEIADSRCAVYVDTDVSPETGVKAAGSKPLQGIIPDFVLSKNTRVACIDAKTKFPRMMQVGFVIRSYEFTLLPPKKQSLPQPLAEACEAIMRANRAFYQSPARP